MRFCECVKAVAETTVKPGDSSFEALQEPFVHEKQHYREQGNDTAEKFLFNVTHQTWNRKTRLTEQTRNKLCLLLARDVYPSSVFTPELGWVIILCEGSLRDLLFQRFQAYYDTKPPRKNAGAK